MNDNPIGIFDSGVGGLTVAKAIKKILPNESIVYYGDTAHLPYGEKSPDAIREYSLGIANFLIKKKNAKAILIACNSASAVAYDQLREEFGKDVPVLNVIDPVVEYVSEKYVEKQIGVIGTRATIGSNSYQKKIHTLNPSLKVKSLATPLLVPIIEEGLADSSLSSEAINHYLNHKFLDNIESLILGCTHYPLILKNIESFYKNEIEIIDSPSIVAIKLQSELEKKGLLGSNTKKPVYEFFLSDYTDVFKRISEVIFDNIDLKEENIWH